MSGVSYQVCTASNPGAIGIVELYGERVPAVIEKLTGRAPSSLRSFVADFGGIDEGVVIVLRDDWAQLMPHCGPRVMQRLAEKLGSLGAVPADPSPARLIYPEA